MGARSGNNYLSALRKLKANLWLDDEHIADPSIHPAFVERARAIASLYDLQAENPGAMTYRLDDGSRAGLSFIQPASAHDVRKRGAMFRRWASQTGGAFLTPDRHNATLSALAVAAELFRSDDRPFETNVRSYYIEARTRDWCCAGTRPNTESASGTLEIVTEASDGVVVSGVVGLDALAPFVEQLLILSNQPTDIAASSGQYLVFAINANTAGLKITSRDGNADGFDCVASFDEVLIPAGRIFFRGEVSRWQALSAATDAPTNALHFDAVRMVARAEAMLANNSGDAHASKLAAMRAALDRAEADAHPSRWRQFVPARKPLEAVMTLFGDLAGNEK